MSCAHLVALGAGDGAGCRGLAVHPSRRGGIQFSHAAFQGRGETRVQNQGDLHDFSLWASPLCGKDALLTIPATTERPMLHG